MISEEGEKLTKLSNILEDDENSNLNFGVSFNSEYQPYMRKEGQVNCLTVQTKMMSGEEIDTSVLAKILSEKYGIPIKEDSLDETFDESEFLVSASFTQIRAKRI